MPKAKNTNKGAKEEPQLQPQLEAGSVNLSGKIRYVGPAHVGRFVLPDNTMIRRESPEDDIRRAIARYPDALSMYFVEEEE